MPPPPPIYKPAARHSSRMLTSTSTICFSPAPLGKLAVQDPPLARPRRRTQLADGAPHIHFLLAAQILCIPPLAADDMLERQQGGLSIPPEREGGSSQCPARTNLRDRRCPDCVPTGEQDFDDPRPDEVAGVGDAQGGGGHRALTPSPFFLSGRWCRQANGFVRERANRVLFLRSAAPKSLLPGAPVPIKYQHCLSTGYTLVWWTFTKSKLQHRCCSGLDRGDGTMIKRKENTTEGTY
ncbi:uncharacterized protein [Zea mays]|uniref:uncharacterized protein isoform X1 n=1 Tax=Zea mays TaxID=4577 RepID=UPI0016528003|nr:uncharacterized protein LOC100193814 isoform X1 [Zea mays]